MSKDLRFTLGAILVQFAVQFSLHLFYPNSLIVFFSVCLIFIIILGSSILFVKSNKEQFVGRFMLATTVQMVSAMAIMAALVFMKVPDTVRQVLLFLSSFVLHLILQSIYLILRTRKASK